MNVVLDIPKDLQAHIKAQIQAGIYSSAVEYFLDLGQIEKMSRVFAYHFQLRSLHFDRFVLIKLMVVGKYS